MLDFLAVGDITIDTFIRLKEAQVHCDLNHEHCRLSISFGDKIPYEFAEDISAVGNSPNAAVSAARLGLVSGLVSDIGKDRGGEECLMQLKKEGVNTKFVSIHQGLPTNHHYVLWYEDERTILVKHTPYPYHFPAVAAPRWIYLSSIGANSEKYHDEIAEYLEKNSSVKLAFQPGTFQINAGKERMGRLYARAEVIAVNVEEARKITGAEDATPTDLLNALRTLGPKMALVTDGPKGAYLHDGTDQWFLPIYPDKKPPYQRTGAGDATASSFVSGMIAGQTPIEALKWGHINAQSVVQQLGAQRGLLTRSEVEKALAEAPPEFKEKKL